MEDGLSWVKDLIRDVPDFPTPGVVFKDLTPLLSDHRGLTECIGALAGAYADAGVTKVVGIEARGFILASPVALELGAGVIPVRKPGKLPWRTLSEPYELEYGTDTLEIHDDAVGRHDRVLIVDDVLATGGTASACARLVTRAGAAVAGFAFVIELGFLGGRGKLGTLDAVSLITYD